MVIQTNEVSCEQNHTKKQNTPNKLLINKFVFTGGLGTASVEEKVLHIYLDQPILIIDHHILYQHFDMRTLHPIWMLKVPFGVTG